MHSCEARQASSLGCRVTAPGSRPVDCLLSGRRRSRLKAAPWGRALSTQAHQTTSLPSRCPSLPHGATRCAGTMAMGCPSHLSQISSLLRFHPGDRPHSARNRTCAQARDCPCALWWRAWTGEASSKARQRVAEEKSPSTPLPRCRCSVALFFHVTRLHRRLALAMAHIISPTCNSFCAS
jgi:hypothetical protein